MSTVENEDSIHKRRLVFDEDVDKQHREHLQTHIRRVYKVMQRVRSYRTGIFSFVQDNNVFTRESPISVPGHMRQDTCALMKSEGCICYPAEKGPWYILMFTQYMGKLPLCVAIDRAYNIYPLHVIVNKPVVLKGTVMEVQLVSNTMFRVHDLVQFNNTTMQKHTYAHRLQKMQSVLTMFTSPQFVFEMVQPTYLKDAKALIARVMKPLSPPCPRDIDTVMSDTSVGVIFRDLLQEGTGKGFQPGFPYHLLAQYHMLDIYVKNGHFYVHQNNSFVDIDIYCDPLHMPQEDGLYLCLCFLVHMSMESTITTPQETDTGHEPVSNTPTLVSRPASEPRIDAIMLGMLDQEMETGQTCTGREDTTIKTTTLYHHQFGVHPICKTTHRSMPDSMEMFHDVFHTLLRPIDIDVFD